MTEKEFTIADALQVQTEDLARWETVLNESAYTALKALCVAKNLEGYEDAYRVFRGQDLTTYVANLGRALYGAKEKK